jgi:hypothetical protein
MEDFSWGLLMGFIAGVMLATIFLNSTWESDLIDRGLAIYCPLDGQFAFVGGCK